MKQTYYKNILNIIFYNNNVIDIIKFYINLVKFKRYFIRNKVKRSSNMKRRE